MQGSSLHKTIPITLKAYGERAIIVESTEHSEHILARQKLLWSLETMLRTSAEDAVEDIVLGNGNLTVIFDPLQVRSEKIEAWIQSKWALLHDSPSSTPANAQTTHVLSARFTNDVALDLKPLALKKKRSTDSIIAEFCSQEYTVLFLGFLPGFSYLFGLPESLHSDRHLTPRAIVPEGSIAIGGSQAGIYPMASPGGWQVIGRVNEQHLPLFTPMHPQPSMFSPGDVVQFVAE